MNIDIINRQVAKKLGIRETVIAQVNRYYWRKIYDHVYSFDPRPVNVQHLFVLYPSKQSVKKAIIKYIKKIRSAYRNLKYLPDSIKRTEMLESVKHIFRGFWQIRKANKYTN